MTPSPPRRHRAPLVDPDEPVYVISVAAELVGAHPQTLRGYERAGLVEPARTGGGSRRYSANDIARLRRIGRLTDEGIPLSAVGRILELERRLAEATGPSTALVRREPPHAPAERTTVRVRYGRRSTSPSPHPREPAS